MSNVALKKILSRPPEAPDIVLKKASEKELRELMQLHHLGIWGELCQDGDHDERRNLFSVALAEGSTKIRLYCAWCGVFIKTETA